MTKRSREQWQSLFAKQASSGLSQAQFCKREGLCPKHFSQRRRQLNQVSLPTTQGRGPLIQVTPPHSHSSLAISLHYQGIEIRLPQADAAFVATLAKQLV